MSKINLYSSKSEIESFITNTKLSELKKEATYLREKNFEKEIQLCSIINAKSGECTEDCVYCAQSIHHKSNVEKYQLLDPEKITEHALNVEKDGVSNFGIVTSGNTLTDKELDKVCIAIENIIKHGNIKVCASLGTLSIAQLKRLKSAGLSRYHHNLETSKNYFPHICPTHNFEERMETLLRAEKEDLEVCSGGLFGMGEKWSDRIDLAILLYKLKMKNIPINFLTPIAGTPLENQNLLSVEEALRIIALYRLLLPESTIRICGGRSKVFNMDQQIEIYLAGANAVMTGNYLTTLGITPDEDKKIISHLNQ